MGTLVPGSHMHVASNTTFSISLGACQIILSTVLAFNVSAIPKHFLLSVASWLISNQVQFSVYGKILQEHTLPPFCHMKSMVKSAPVAPGIFATRRREYLAENIVNP